MTGLGLLDHQGLDLILGHGMFAARLADIQPLGVAPVDVPAVHELRVCVRLGAADVTFVMCSNRGEVDGLSPQQRACAYPCVQVSHAAAQTLR